MRPHANTEAMQLHLDGISKYGARKAHAVGLMDRAGWHSTGKRIVAKNLTIILPPRKEKPLIPAVKKAKAAGIPTFLVDRSVDPNTAKAGVDYVSFMGSDLSISDAAWRNGRLPISKVTRV